MGIKQTVFASLSEKWNFERLKRSWGDRYRIYHNLPYLQVIDPTGDRSTYPDGHPLPPVSVGDRNTLKKTSIDFTLCDEGDRPLLSIEFDGMCQGYNIGTEYVGHGADEWRDSIMRLKLSVAHSYWYPYVVLGDREFRSVVQGVQDAVVDGIIGSVMAWYHAEEDAIMIDYQAMFGLSDAEFTAKPPSERLRLMEQWLAEHDEEGPPERGSLELKIREIDSELGGCFYAFEEHLVPGPPLESARFIGGVATVSHPNLGEQIETILMPNINSPGVSRKLPEQVATLKAIKRLQLKAAN